MLTIQCLKCKKVLKGETEELLQSKLHLHLTQRKNGCKPKEVKGE